MPAPVWAEMLFLNIAVSIIRYKWRMIDHDLLWPIAPDLTSELFLF